MNNILCVIHKCYLTDTHTHGYNIFIEKVYRHIFLHLLPHKKHRLVLLEGLFRII